MAKKKIKDHGKVTDWYGNAIEREYTGIPKGHFSGEVDPDGKKYVRAYDGGGVPQDRLAVEDMYLCLKDEDGKVIYDSRCKPPPEANLLHNYIGYVREKQLKRYFLP